MAFKLQPKIHIEQDQADKVIELCGLISLALLIGFAIYYYPRLPAIIPTHFNMHGKPDDYGSKTVALLFPGIALVNYVILTIACRVPHSFNYIVAITEENAERQYKNAVKMMRILKVLIILLMLLCLKSMGSSAIDGGEVDITAVLVVMLVLLSGCIGYFMYRSYKLK